MSVIREPEAGWWQAQEAQDGADPTVTVVVLHDHEARGDGGSAMSRLAARAGLDDDELLVMLGMSAPAPDHRAVITGLRERLPGRRVVELRVRRDDTFQECAIAAGQLLAEGGLPVVVTSAAALHTVTAQLSSYLRADQVLRVLQTAWGTDLHQVWSRRSDPVLN
ncbi:hypothetical protein OHA21_25900 [Actinoplanes sp. NBC_00393]|uniref:hypothetical protein n=1 Tax=Actinoplanes sp. NBC_00393 TaxID=2975953 RepID=UPI002E1F0532